MATKKRAVKSNPNSGQFDGSVWDQIHGAIEANNKSAPITINENTAFRSTAFYTSIKKICETMSSIPFCIYEKLPNGGKRKADDHPWYHLLHDRPNEDMNRQTFVSTACNHFLVSGNAYIQLDWTVDGNLTSMTPALPTNIQIVRDPSSGKLVYIYEIDSQKQTYTDNKMAHVKNLSDDGLRGMSPVWNMRRTLEYDQRSEQYQLDFFNGGGRVPGMYKSTTKINDEAKKETRENIGAQAFRRGMVILPPWLEWINTGVTQEQAQWIEGRKFSEAQIYGLFNIPVGLITGEGDAKENYKQFVNQAIHPIVQAFEVELTSRLFPPNEDGSANDFYCAFNIDGLLRADIATRYAAYAVGRQWGWESANSVLSLEDRNPIEGGDVYMNPLNMIPASIDGKAVYLYQDPNSQNAKQANPDQLPSDRPRDPQGEIRSLVDQFSPQVFDALRRMAAREQKNLEAMIGKPDYPAKVIEFFQRHATTLYQALEPSFLGIATAQGIEANRDLLRSHCETYCGTALMRALAGELQIVTDDELVKRSNITVASFVRSYHG